MFVSQKAKEALDSAEKKEKKMNKGLIFGGLFVVAGGLGFLVVAQKDKFDSNSFFDFPTPIYSNDSFGYEEITRMTIDNGFVSTGRTCIFDRKYEGVTSDYFEKFNSTFASMLLHGSSYSKDKFECNQIALAYKSHMQMGVFKNSKDGAIAVGVLIVKNNHEFGGVGGTGNMHAVCVVKVDGDWLVVEPQPRNGYVEASTLSDYPNPIYYAIF